MPAVTVPARIGPARPSSGHFITSPPPSQHSLVTRYRSSAPSHTVNSSNNPSSTRTSLDLGDGDRLPVRVHDGKLVPHRPAPPDKNRRRPEFDSLLVVAEGHGRRAELSLV